MIKVLWFPFIPVLVAALCRWIALPAVSSQPVPSGEFAGEPTWVFDLEEDFRCASDDGSSRIYLQTGDSIYALDALNGKMLWESALPELTQPCLPPVAAEPYLLLAGEDGALVALQEETGQPLWQSRLTIDQQSTSAIGTEYIRTILVDGQTAYVARYGATLTAYDLASGMERWFVALEEMPITLAIVDERLYVGSEYSLLTLRSGQGELLWEKYLGYYGYLRDMAADKDRVYMALGSESGDYITALSQNGSSILWTTLISEIGLSYINTFLLQGDALYICGDRLLALSSRTGDLIWKTDQMADLGRPVLLKDSIVVREGGLAVHAFDRSSGVEIGKLSLPAGALPGSELSHKPLHAGDSLVIVIQGSRLYAYQLRQRLP
jgi:outer membrane protein assembly factor BamB